MSNFFFKITFLVRQTFKLLRFFGTNLTLIKKAEICFFFPSYHTGGAEKVHLDIIRTLYLEKNGVIFFTENSSNQQFRTDFEKLMPCFEIAEYLHLNLRIRFLFELILVKMMNQSKKLKIVFGANSTFYYDLIPEMNEKIKKMDLIHAFSYPDYGFEDYSLSLVPLLNNRITISEKSVEDFRLLYEKNGICEYFERVECIHNFCEFEPVNNEFLVNKFANIKELNIAWIGRFSKEKEPGVFLKLSKQFENSNLPINFNMVTDRYDDEIRDSKVNFIGRIENSNNMKEFLRSQHILIITSYREGLPLVFAESISQGVVVISTNVGAMSNFIENEINGFIIPEINHLDYLKNLINRISKVPAILLPLASRGLKVYDENFKKDKFTKAYKKLLNV